MQMARFIFIVFGIPISGAFLQLIALGFRNSVESLSPFVFYSLSKTMALAVSDVVQSVTMDSCVTKRDKVQMGYKWTIEDFMELPHTCGLALQSDEFPSATGQPAYWQLSVYPRGTSSENQNNVVFSLYLKSSENSTIRIKYKLRFEDSHGNVVYSSQSFPATFTKGSNNGNQSCCVRRDSLLDDLKKSKNGALIVNCDIIVFLDSINVPEPSSQLSFKLFNDMTASNNLEGLRSDGTYSDFVINVGKRKFKVHKVILHARSPVFAAMFSSLLEESKTNEVTITDVDADIFEKLMIFIYTGTLKSPDKDAIELLPVADKYDIGCLKQQCADALATRLSTTSALNTLILAYLYSLEDLKIKTMAFICANKEIVSKMANMTEIVKYPELVAELFAETSKANDGQTTTSVN